MTLRLSEISKSYHHYRVLHEISLNIKEGNCFALFGPNGAGKTTLLRILATLIRPSSGKFEILGFDGMKEKNRAREHLFLIGHGSYLYDDLNVLENIRFALQIRGGHFDDRRIKAALDRVGMGAFGKLKSRFLSAGMKKRVSIAKAILVRPKILLLDEGYAALDEKGMDLLNQIIREFTMEGITVFMTTHERVRTAEVAHRAGILQNGSFREVPVNELVENHALF